MIRAIFVESMKFKQLTTIFYGSSYEVHLKSKMFNITIFTVISRQVTMQVDVMTSCYNITRHVATQATIEATHH